MTAKERRNLALEAMVYGNVTILELKELKDRYEKASGIAESEDAAYVDSFSDLYVYMREVSSASQDYIKALEGRITYLEELTLEFASGKATRNAEAIYALIKSYWEKR